MSKLDLYRIPNRLNLAVRTIGSATISHGFSSLSETPPPQQQTLDSTVDSFVQSQSPRMSYWRLLGITKNTLRSDIVNFLEDCKLTLDDVKVEYNWNYLPVSMMIRFGSQQAYNQANKMNSRKGRLYRMEKSEQAEWDKVAPYEGKAVLIQGLPHTTTIPELERFLSGFSYFENSFQIFVRGGARGKMAIVRFPSQIEAMNCFIAKNKSFCLSSQVLVRVLQ